MRPARPSAVALLAALLATLLAILAGCATPGEFACSAGQQVSISDLLYFGTNKPGGVVSAEQWSQFLRETVTPRFPAGLTSWQASGQWQAADGTLTHEDSYVLNLVHSADPKTETAIRSIMSEYKTRFRQEAVLRVSSPACASF